ncbi:adenylyl-sulfate kinase [Pseudomonas chlororaphis]|uniref:adenylyl-sulfate kinase n=1 Tax=Pseudomonas chlororaphis TaxID=587753 RepID=UPI000F56F4EF|nr:adenylyl-sulfate kinase [Pseudomonas chlororaphis]AZE08097.1 Adenylylsulfate kinase [Pseudomonas chlororaphis subsp. aureofaciens]MBP5066233.1 adenylyl-sulfate kinase [Pseudomonas chlororaphis]QTT97308.1 adenylyl-sulfate kinase [Pseudomonas chlororaphis]
MVIWLVGMSGAGKTTIGRALYASLKVQRPQTVFVDGDEIRALFRHDQRADAYSVAGRRVNAERIQALCGWLDGQGIDVVCCILSMFQDISDDNRQRFSSYREVFVDVPLSTLVSRDNKGLYQSALRGEQSNVVGVDIEYPTPQRPDLVLHNRHEPDDIPGYVERIRQLCGYPPSC